MGDYLMIILGTALVNNVVLVRFLGLCPFMGVSNKLDSALGMGLATTFVLVCSNIVVSTLRKLIPAKVRIPAFIVVIASFVTVVQLCPETKSFFASPP